MWLKAFPVYPGQSVYRSNSLIRGFQFSFESGQGDAECFGGLRVIAGTFAENESDVAHLHFIERQDGRIGINAPGPGGGRLRGFLRLAEQFRGPEIAPPLEQVRSLQDILEFPDISRPVVAAQVGDLRAGERDLVPVGERFKQMFAKLRDIGTALTERRDMHPDYAQTVIEVLSESLSQKILKLYAGCRDDPDVDGPDRLAAEPSELFLFDGGQELRL